MAAMIRLSRKARLRWDPWEGRFILLYPERGLLLNDAAYAVLSLCDGAHSAEEMASLLAERFSIRDTNRVFATVSAFLARLDGLGLLETEAEDRA